GVQGGFTMSYLVNETGWSVGPYMGQGIKDQVVTIPGDVIFVGEAVGVDARLVGLPGYSCWDCNICYTTPARVNAGGGPNPAVDQQLGWKDFINIPGSDWGSRGYAIAMPARHHDGNNVLFYDGHVKWLKQSLGVNWRVPQ